MTRGVEYIVVMYNNRTDTMKLHQCLNRLGVKNSIIPTPNQLSSSCGLSIKARYVDVNKILFCVNKGNLSQNYNIYGEQRFYNRIIYTKIK